MKPGLKKWLLAIFILSLGGASFVGYMFTLKHDDTAQLKVDFTVESLVFINDFKTDLTAANEKYSEKIVVVNGTVSEVEMADTTANIKMVDTTNGDYIIFAFQQQYLNDAKKLKPGEKVSIKGSCSNGDFSAILETYYVTFKRCTINK